MPLTEHEFEGTPLFLSGSERRVLEEKTNPGGKRRRKIMERYIKSISIKGDAGVKLAKLKCCESCNKGICDLPCKDFINVLSEADKVDSIDIEFGIQSRKYNWNYIIIILMIILIGLTGWRIIDNSDVDDQSAITIVKLHDDQRLNSKDVEIVVNGNTNLPEQAVQGCNRVSERK